MSLRNEFKFDIFTVLADPKRRLILDTLSEHTKTVTELVKITHMHQSGVSRHLKILQNIGLVTFEKENQNHVYSLSSGPLLEVEEWLEKYRQQWNSRFKKLEKHLKLQQGK